jgi:transitional endoplasmic reticulum ATPase
MNEFDIARAMLVGAARELPATSPLAKDLLDWARGNAAWLFGRKAEGGRKIGWDGLLRKLQAAKPRAEELPQPLLMAEALSRLLRLDPLESRMVAVMVACDRLRHPARLCDILVRHGNNLPALIGEVSGAEPHEAERRARGCVLCRFGLVRFVADWRGATTLQIRWTFEQMLDAAPTDAAGIVAAMVGPPQPAQLKLEHFAHVEAAPFLVRLLEGARRERAEGINLLIHGPPGTGKTELARTLAAAADLTLHGAGEALDDGTEPSRWDRVNALRIGQQLLAGDPGAALLFDEMEDLIGGAAPGDGDWMRGREGSKVFVNRLLESNPVPVIWTTNAIGNIDAAILRRMSFVLELPLPSRATALRLLDHVAGEEGVRPGADFAALIEAAPETATVLRTAMRSARLAESDDGGLTSAASLVKALLGDEPPPPGPGPIDPELCRTDLPLGELFARIRASQASDVSLLLTGPPGTGKTALAHQLARELDRPLLVRRGSDLLSKWVGGTERLIAGAFAEARERGAVLLFDEADGLLFDRATARASWEVGQVNELLTWLDRHPLPVVAATNHGHRLDPATLRRFVFKLELLPLDRARATRAFERFFELPAPASLAGIERLTPGDFAVVARQLRHFPAACTEEIVTRLASEVAAKPGAMGRIGF